MLWKNDQLRMVQKDFFFTALVPWFVEQGAGYRISSVV